MRTILNEQFVNNNYSTRAAALQQIIDTDVNTDPNTFYSYTEFTSNINSSVGSGPIPITGITELMNARITHLQGLNEFTATPPTVSNISSNPTNVLPHSTINITAEISNSNYAYLGYRFKFSTEFEKLQMFDDGQHGDGSAGDGVFGCLLYTSDAADE